MTPRIGDWLAVDGFNLFEGPERWKYVRVLAVVPSMAAAERHGMPVGPVDAGDLFARVNGALCLPALDPHGYTPEQTAFKPPACSFAPVR